MKTHGGAVGFGRGRVPSKNSTAEPRCPPGWDYRQIVVEHFLVGGFETGRERQAHELRSCTDFKFFEMRQRNRLGVECPYQRASARRLRREQI